MKLILYSISVAVLISTTGCLIPVHHEREYVRYPEYRHEHHWEHRGVYPEYREYHEWR